MTNLASELAALGLGTPEILDIVPSSEEVGDFDFNPSELEGLEIGVSPAAEIAAGVSEPEAESEGETAPEPPAIPSGWGTFKDVPVDWCALFVPVGKVDKKTAERLSELCFCKVGGAWLCRSFTEEGAGGKLSRALSLCEGSGVVVNRASVLSSAA